MDAIEAKFRRILRDHLGIDQRSLEEITRETDLEADLNADSLDKIEVMLAIEDDFKIQLPDTAPDTARTYGEVLDLIYGITGRPC